jgi:hypothetical protein
MCGILVRIQIHTKKIIWHSLSFCCAAWIRCSQAARYFWLCTVWHNDTAPEHTSTHQGVPSRTSSGNLAYLGFRLDTVIHRSSMHHFWENKFRSHSGQGGIFSRDGRHNSFGHISHWIDAASELLEERRRSEQMVRWRFCGFDYLCNLRPCCSTTNGKLQFIFPFLLI